MFLRGRAPCWLYCIRSRPIAAPCSFAQFSSSPQPTGQCALAPCVYRCPRQDLSRAFPMRSHQRFFTTTLPNNTNFRKLFRRKYTAEDWRLADDLDANHNLVYQSGSTYYVRSALGMIEVFAVLFAGNCAAAAVGICDHPFVLSMETVVYLSFFCAYSYGIKSIARTYPLRIYFNEEQRKFTAVFIGYHPFSYRHLEISPREVKTKEATFLSNNVLPWGKDVCSIKGKQDIILSASNFSSPVYYNMLLGYGKISP